MPWRVIIACLLACACAGCSRDHTPLPDAARADDAATGSESCTLGAADSDVDVHAGTWRRLVAPHGTGTNAVPLQVDAVLATCESIVSLAHDPGPGGKIFDPGPSRLLWSRDGREWELRDKLATDRILGAIAWGAGTWVAVGSSSEGGMIAASTQADASDWRDVFHHTESFNGVAFGAGAFVAVAQNGVAASSDGEQWHWAQLPAKQALYFDVAFGAGRFVVAGVGAVLNSADGETWQESSCGTCAVIQTPSGPSGTEIALQEIHFAGGAFHGFGASGQLTSRDGVTFVPFDGERVPDAAFGASLLNISASPLVGADSDGLFASSDMGASWSSLPLQPDVDSVDCTANRCIAADNKLLVFDPDP